MNVHERGDGPTHGETLQAWVMRLGQRKHRDYVRLKALLPLHYRYRFDPRGLSPKQRLQLRTAATHAPQYRLGTP